jgi:hypothetical protein
VQLFGFARGGRFSLANDITAGNSIASKLMFFENINLTIKIELPQNTNYPRAWNLASGRYSAKGREMADETGQENRYSEGRTHIIRLDFV